MNSATKSNSKNNVGLSTIHALIYGLLLALATTQVSAIPSSVIRQHAAEQKQNTIIELSGRIDAESFQDVNRLLNSGNKKAVIKKAKTVLEKHPDSGLANEVLGTAYYMDGQQQNAVAALKRAAKLEPSRSDALTKLGIINMENNKLAEAEKLLLQAVEITPSNRYAHQRLGLLYEYQNKNNLAIQHFIKGLQGTDNRYLGIAVNLGRLLNKAGNYPATIQVLEPRAPMRATDADAQLLLATAYLATGQYSKARSRYQRTLILGQHSNEALLGLAKAQRGEGDYKSALNTISKLLRVRPKSTAAKIEEGEILLRLGKVSQSETAFDMAVLLGADRSYINQRIAKTYLDQKQYTKARDIYQAMVDDKTADASVFSALSELLMQGGDVDKGEQVLIEGIKRFPDSAYLHLRYGSYLASLGQYEESLPALQKATTLAPKDATVWKSYAFALTRAGKNDKAAEASAKLYKLQPNNIDVAVFHASRLEAVNRADDAETIYLNVIKAAPDHALALNNLANILADKHDYIEAEKLSRHAAKVAGDNANIQDTLGMILYKQDRLNEALDILSYASKLSPESATILYHKGLILKKSGRHTEARIAFEKALAIDTSAEWAEDARKQLK